MKPKQGKCIDCPTGSKDVPLIAKRCQNHYWKHREEVNKDKKGKTEKKQKKAKLDVFFASELQQVPRCCDECGASLAHTMAISRKAVVAHVLPKRHFESIMLHPWNKFFACGDCHTNFDNLGEPFVIKMKMYPELKRRVQEILLPLIEPQEMKYIPTYFL